MAKTYKGFKGFRRFQKWMAGRIPQQHAVPGAPTRINAINLPPADQWAPGGAKSRELDLGGIQRKIDGSPIGKQINSALDAYQKSMLKAAKATTNTANATNAMQKQMYNISKAGVIASTVLGAVSSVINELTFSATKRVAQARGELSAARTMEMKHATGAGFVKGIPIVGSAVGGVMQAGHDMQQQALGTEFMARAAAVFESSIPKMDAALDNLAVSIKKGAIGIAYAFAPAEGAYAQRLLDINTGPAAQALQGLRGQRRVAMDLLGSRQADYDTAAAQLAGRGGRKADQYAIANTAKEKLRQASELTDQYATPTVRKAEDMLRIGLATKRAQAGQEYMLDYYKGFSPTSGANWGSFGRAGDPGGLPKIDRVVTEVELTAAIKALTQALEGINPTGRTGA